MKGPKHIFTAVILMCVYKLMLVACQPTTILPNPEEQFIKYIGSGIRNEAVDLEIDESENIFIFGNEYVRFQDSAAFYLVKLNPNGQVLWTSERNYGAGFSNAAALTVDDGGNIYTVANSRTQNQQRTYSILQKWDTNGSLVWEYIDELNSFSNKTNAVYIDQSLNRLVLVGSTDRNGTSDLLIRLYDPSDGQLIREHIRPSNAFTEGVKIIKAQNYGRTWYYVLAHTQEQNSGLANQNILIAQYSMDLIPADNIIFGTERTDQIGDAIYSINENISVISSHIEGTLSDAKLYQVKKSPDSLFVSNQIDFNYNQDNRGLAINESSNGFIMLGITAGEERASNRNVFLMKTRLNGENLWDSPLRIGGNGNDVISKIKIREDYIYLLSTIDLQNDNQMIALSKLKY